jgi:pyrroline-5-carboxylate reductase
VAGPLSVSLILSFAGFTTLYPSATPVQVLEAMADGGVRAGLPRQKALILAAQTMKGAAEMVLNTAGEGGLNHPGVLKDQVTSPGGTTITALSVLEDEGVRSAFIKAVGAAAGQAKKMSASR